MENTEQPKPETKKKAATWAMPALVCIGLIAGCGGTGNNSKLMANCTTTRTASCTAPTNTW